MKIDGFVENLKSPQQEQKEWIEQLREMDKRTYGPACSLERPLLISIPREGTIIPCEKHPGGHFIRPSTFIY